MSMSAKTVTYGDVLGADLVRAREISSAAERGTTVE